jgi:hypothetical protein
MAVTSADYATCQAALRRVLANGGLLDGVEKRLLLDVIQHASSNERDAAALALSAEVDAQLALWLADGAGDSSATQAAAAAALAPLQAAAIAGAVITDLTADDILDGRDT